MSSSVYAKLAEAAYSNDPKYEIDGYQLLPNYSNDRVKVYTGRNDEIVFAIRGTRVTDARDLVADLHIVKDKLKQDKTYQEVKYQLRRIIALKRNWKIIVCGHSLGQNL